MPGGGDGKLIIKGPRPYTNLTYLIGSASALPSLKRLELKVLSLVNLCSILEHSPKSLISCT